MGAAMRFRCRRLFWRGYSEGRIARRLNVTRLQVRRALFAGGL